MKLESNNKVGLMDITRISSEGSKIVVTGIIMGSVPIRAVLTTAELRKALSLMSLKTMIAAGWIMLWR